MASPGNNPFDTLAGPRNNTLTVTTVSASGRDKHITALYFGQKDPGVFQSSPPRISRRLPSISLVISVH